jgi:thiol-disulfide isomerase/thioredoxin
MEILRARNISTYEKLEIFNSFPWEQQKSDIGNFIKNQLEAVFKKEKTLFFDESLMKHKFSMLGGNDFSIGEINTAYIFLEFWASWCLPCRVGNKEINKNAEFVTGNKNVSMVAISIDKDKEKWVKAIKQDSLKIFKYHLSDNKGWNSSFLKTLQIDAIPYNILITRSGKVINANISKDKIIEAIQKLSN